VYQTRSEGQTKGRDPITRDWESIYTSREN
jgi:hypothetical protein